MKVDSKQPQNSQQKIRTTSRSSGQKRLQSLVATTLAALARTPSGLALLALRAEEYRDAVKRALANRPSELSKFKLWFEDLPGATAYKKVSEGKYVKRDKTKR